MVLLGTQNLLAGVDQLNFLLDFVKLSHGLFSLFLLVCSDVLLSLLCQDVDLIVHLIRLVGKLADLLFEPPNNFLGFKVLIDGWRRWWWRSLLLFITSTEEFFEH